MRHIYISPHLDDAILSCGGWIWEQTRSGIVVEVWTICTGDPPERISPFAETLHAQWGTGRETPAIRRKEDMAACSRVGARYRHLPLQDCIYRSAPDGAWLYDPLTLMGEIHPLDRPLIETLRLFLAASLKPDDRLLCPLTVGGHADHRLTRLAVEALGRPLLYYADVPYVLNQPTALEPLTNDKQFVIQPVSEAGLNAWQDGIAAYASQIGMLFETPERMREMIRLYWLSHAGIRLWQKG
jgi:LmbE family N-acetylglucosaminyl deacetylase